MRKPKLKQPSPDTARSKPGRLPHVPTPSMREHVTVWAGGGIEHEMIAASLRIHAQTLRKYYADELLTGKAAMAGLAVSTLANAMKEGGAVGVRAAEHWTKHRMGWSETLKIDDGKPRDVPMKVLIEYVGEAGPSARMEQTAPRAAGRLIDVELKG